MSQDHISNDERAPFVAFSIASRNYICYVNALYDSLVAQYGSVHFFFALADSDSDFDHAELPYEIISLSDLRDLRLWGMAERYNITEFNTAIKPFAFQFLIDRFPGETILYFDPDIFVVSRLTEVEEAFKAGANAVLTPHLIEPPGDDLVNDEELLKYGIYNLGFVGLRANTQVEELIRWWCDRMERRCLIDFPNGLFVDQKWCDFIPAYLDHTFVLRHPGYNVAYWNLPDRLVAFSEGKWTCNDTDLRFVHFSGADILHPNVFSRHSQFLHHSVIGDLRYLLELYREKVLQGGLKRFGRYEYAFRYTGAKGDVNVHTAVSLSTKIKGDKGVVDHTLPPFGPMGSAVPNSIGHADPLPVLLTLAFRSDRDLLDWTANNPDGLNHLREIKTNILANPEDIRHVSGICGMCRTTSPFLCFKKKCDENNWSDNLTCRCGFDAVERALIHAARSIGRIAQKDAIMIDTPNSELLKWAMIHWPKTEPFTGKSDSVSLILVDGVDPCKVSESIEAYERGLEVGGMLLISLRKSCVEQGLSGNLEFLDRLVVGGFEDCQCILYTSSEMGYFDESASLLVGVKTRLERR